jgi:hypothetical protein
VPDAQLAKLGLDLPPQHHRADQSTADADCSASTVNAASPRRRFTGRIPASRCRLAATPPASRGATSRRGGRGRVLAGRPCAPSEVRAGYLGRGGYWPDGRQHHSELGRIGQATTGVRCNGRGGHGVDVVHRDAACHRNSDEREPGPAYAGSDTVEQLRSPRRPVVQVGGSTVASPSYCPGAPVSRYEAMDYPAGSSFACGARGNSAVGTRTSLPWR